MPHLSLTEMEQMFCGIHRMPAREQVRVIEMQYAIEWEILRTMRPPTVEGQLVPAPVSLAIIRNVSLWKRLIGPSHLQRLQTAFGKVWATIDGMEKMRGRPRDPRRLSGGPVILPIAVTRELEQFDAKWRSAA